MAPGVRGRVDAGTASTMPGRPSSTCRSTRWLSSSASVGPDGAVTKTEIETAVYAAGGVVWRQVEGKLRILLIHRTKYRDLTLPKGKVDPGETLAETAVREIR